MNVSAVKFQLTTCQIQIKLVEEVAGRDLLKSVNPNPKAGVVKILAT
jgi:hypothetical protein